MWFAHTNKKRLKRRENGDKMVEEIVFAGRPMVVSNSGEMNFGRRDDDETRRDETRRDETRRDETRRDETRRDETRRDETRRDEKPAAERD